jgi:peptidoglycan/LPS O-acetylase OafA/YrhL
MTSQTHVRRALTLDDAMNGAGGRTTGFDYLRLGLAIAVVCSHSIDVSYGYDYAVLIENGAMRPFIGIILAMFFALSGFLVAGSLERCRSLVSFMGLRLIRLVPALAFETALAALVLGPWLSTLPLLAYFQDPLFARYFLNIAGDIQYLLPGMFATNPWPDTVNAQLWTLPYELACYLALFVLALFGIHRHRQMFGFIVVALNVALATKYMVVGQWAKGPTLTGDALVLCFLYGITFYLYRRQVLHELRLAIAAAVVCVVLLVHPATNYLAPVFAAYLTAFLGLLRPAKIPLIGSGDYSYGIFLYGFPVQQAVIYLLGPVSHNWMLNILISLPVTVGLAILSWHWIEKPALALRGRLNQLEDVWLTFKANLKLGVLRGKMARP